MACLLLMAVLSSHAQYYPKPTGFINDFEKDFSKEQYEALDLTVKSILVKTMADESLHDLEIAVVTVTDSMFIGETEMSSYAIKIAGKWGLGNKGENYGILIAVSKSLKKVSIATGPGLDKFLAPDACQKIMDEKMTPELKKGRYYEGVMAAILAIKEAIGVK